MKRLQVFLLSMVLIFGTFSITSAELIDNGDGTVTQIRNDGSRLMWLKDANYAKTSGYDSDGRMTWDAAMAWIASLNNSNYLGHNDWRLPVALPVDPNNGYDLDVSCDGSTDHGYNITKPNSEMSYMYYVELGNVGYHASAPPDCTGPYPQLGWQPNPNTCDGPVCFDNVMTTGYTPGDPRMDAAAYWTGNTHPDPVHAFDFRFKYGDQSAHSKSFDNYAWAVRVVLLAKTVEPVEIIVRVGEFFSLANPNETSFLIEKCVEYGIPAISLMIHDDEHGWLYYLSNVPDTKTSDGSDPKYDDYRVGDYLAQFIDLAHQNGIKVYAWMQMFEDEILYNNKPEYRMYEKGLTGPVVNWVSPVINGVRENRKDLFSDVLNRFQFDGIRIDHSRYNSDWEDWSDTSRLYFQFVTDIDPDDLTCCDNDDWKAWIYWRANQISTFNQEIRDLTLEKVPNASIGAYLLPTSATAEGYDGNSESGQRFEDYGTKGMNLAIHPMPMVYWQDWSESPTQFENYVNNTLLYAKQLSTPTEVIPVFSVSENAWGTVLSEDDIRYYMGRVGAISQNIGIKRISYFYYYTWTDDQFKRVQASFVGPTCSPADTNRDGVVDISELLNYISDWKSGLITIEELMIAIDEWKNGCGVDSDGDGLSNQLEITTGTDPNDADTDNDGLVDGNVGSEDLNANGIVDPGETDPLNPDTDGDGIYDGTEKGLTEPETEDTDLSAEFFIPDSDPTTTTDPTNPDTDGDGILDGEEDLNMNGRRDEGETNAGIYSVQIDIKPGSYPNSINLKSKGVIPIAILTTDTFDANTVDPISVEFGPNRATEAHAKGHIEDVDTDGNLDLVFHFKTQDTGIACGDTDASLTGETFDGQLIEGFDSINIVKCE